jgi:membrane associated rhomboid family serine protease
VTEHNAIGTRVQARPVWLTFLMLFLTSGVYRSYWAWKSNTDVGGFGRERAGVVPSERAIRVNANASAFAQLLLLPGAGLFLIALLFAVGSVPAEYGISEPTGSDLVLMLLIGAALVIPAFVSILRTAGRVRRARELAGLAPTTRATGRLFAPLLLLEVIGVPASLFALQHALNDLWSRFPPLLDEDLHGELAPPERRVAAIAERPTLHEQRLARIAQELEIPWLVPWVTIGFGALCVAVFAWQLWMHGPFPDTRDLERVGGLRTGIGGVWWRFWTANVLHASVDHLVGNLLVWGVVATMVERVVGHVRMAALIVIGAAGCSAGSLLTHPDEVGIGASGVVFAAFGLAAMVDPLARRSVGRLGWSLVALGLGLSTFTPGISSGGHVGGVLAGFAFGAFDMLVWRVHRERLRERDLRLVRRAPVDRSAPLAPDRELTISERLEHLAARRRAGAISEHEHDRLRTALLARG